MRGRIERILDFAKAKGWRDGPNPALWRGHLSAILPARAKLGRGHHGAMPYADVPACVGALRARDATAHLALEFTILTAARTGEVLGATWDEVDLEAALWTVPVAWMKAGKPHRVPLAERAVEILRIQLARRTEDDGGFVFSGIKSGRPLSNMALEAVLRRMKLKDSGVTTHGFRSSFRDRCGEETTFPREVAEARLPTASATRQNAPAAAAMHSRSGEI